MRRVKREKLKGVPPEAAMKNEERRMKNEGDMSRVVCCVSSVAIDCYRMGEGVLVATAWGCSCCFQNPLVRMRWVNYFSFIVVAFGDNDVAAS